MSIRRWIKRNGCKRLLSAVFDGTPPPGRPELDAAISFIIVPAVTRYLGAVQRIAFDFETAAAVRCTRFQNTKRDEMRLTRLFTAVVFLAVVFLAASSVSAQVVTSTDAVLPEKPSGNARTEALPIQTDTYGTSSLTWLSLIAWDFHPRDTTTTYGFANSPGYGIYRTGGTPYFEAALHLPAGAVVSALELTGCNTNAANFLDVNFVGPLKAGGFASTPGSISLIANAGCQIIAASAFAWTVNNNTTSYTVEVNFEGAIDNTMILESVRVGYTLQVSPSPSVATFNDVPLTHPFNKFVEALYAAGITAGCGNNNFCPDAPVTRGQMAVFLAAALGLHWAP